MLALAQALANLVEDAPHYRGVPTRAPGAPRNVPSCWSCRARYYWDRVEGRTRLVMDHADDCLHIATLEAIAILDGQ